MVDMVKVLNYAGQQRIVPEIPLVMLKYLQLCQIAVSVDGVLIEEVYSRAPCRISSNVHTIRSMDSCYDATERYKIGHNAVRG